MFNIFLKSCNRHHYANFSGRTSRKDFWEFIADVLVIITILATLGYLLGNYVGHSTFLNAAFYVIVAILFIIFPLLIILPCLAITARRLHDSNNSGWLVLILLFPIMGTLSFIIFGLLPSSPGPNKYGPNPYHECSDKVNANKHKSINIHLLIWALTIMFIGTITLSDYYSNFYHEKSVPGVVVDIKTEVKRLHAAQMNLACSSPFLRYTINDKQYITADELDCLSGNYPVGKHVTVLYPSDDPTYVTVDNKYVDIWRPWAIVAVGTLLLILALTC